MLINSFRCELDFYSSRGAFAQIRPATCTSEEVQKPQIAN